MGGDQNINKRQQVLIWNLQKTQGSYYLAWDITVYPDIIVKDYCILQAGVKGQINLLQLFSLQNLLSHELPVKQDSEHPLFTDKVFVFTNLLWILH